MFTEYFDINSGLFGNNIYVFIFYSSIPYKEIYPNNQSIFRIPKIFYVN